MALQLRAGAARPEEETSIFSTLMETHSRL